MINVTKQLTPEEREQYRRLTMGFMPTTMGQESVPGPQVGPVYNSPMDFNALTNNPASQGVGKLLAAKAAQVEGETNGRHITNLTSPEDWASTFHGASAPPHSWEAAPNGYQGLVADARNIQEANKTLEATPQVGDAIAARFGTPGTTRATTQTGQPAGVPPLINPTQLTAIGASPTSTPNIPVTHPLAAGVPVMPAPTSTPIQRDAIRKYIETGKLY